MSETLDRPSTALATIETLTAVQVFAPNAALGLIERIEREARAVAVDISTERGRKACASLAYKIARSKTALDEMGKSLNDEKRASINAVDAERRTIRSRLDALADEIRAPLTAYENAEKERIAGHEAAIAAIPEAAGYGVAETVSDLQLRLDCLRNYPTRDWREFAERAAKVLATEIERTERLLAATVKREAEAAELARLREQEAERARQAEAEAQRQREADLARKAADAARIEAEQRAAAEKAAMERQAQAERDAAAKREREALEAAERAKEAAARAEQDRVAAEAASKRREAEAAARAEAQRKADAEAAERRQAEAVSAERRRQEQALAAEKAEAERRAADKAHRAKINREALQDLCGAANLTTEQAQGVVIAVASRKVRHMAVSY